MKRKVASGSIGSHDKWRHERFGCLPIGSDRRFEGALGSSPDLCPKLSWNRGSEALVSPASAERQGRGAHLSRRQLDLKLSAFRDAHGTMAPSNHHESMRS